MRKNRSLAVIVGIGATLLISSVVRAAELTVNVTNIATNQGDILIAVCTKDLFLTPRCMPHKKVPAKAGAISVEFPNVVPGTYAVEVVHDVKRLGGIERDSLGIPISGYGLSNNAVGSYGPPTFADAAFGIGTASQAISVRLRYAGTD